MQGTFVDVNKQSPVALVLIAYVYSNERKNVAKSDRLRPFERKPEILLTALGTPQREGCNRRCCIVGLAS